MTLAIGHRGPDRRTLGGSARALGGSSGERCKGFSQLEWLGLQIEPHAAAPFSGPSRKAGQARKEKHQFWKEGDEQQRDKQREDPRGDGPDDETEVATRR